MAVRLAVTRVTGASRFLTGLVTRENRPPSRRLWVMRSGADERQLGLERVLAVRRLGARPAGTRR